MQNVKIKKPDLVGKILGNREEHRELYQEAKVNFRKKAIAAMEKNLSAAKRGKQLSLNIHLQQPEDHTSDYDRVIAMLKMSVDAEITLTAQEFRWYVLDQWQWRDDWVLSNSGYSSKIARLAKG